MRSSKQMVARFKLKISNLPRRTLFIIAGSVAALLIIVGMLLFLGIKDANKKAATYNAALNTYVAKITSARTSIVGMRPIVNQAPQLPSATLSGFSADYQHASARQAVLKVYQDDVFGRLASFNTDTNSLRDTNSANQALLRVARNNDSIPSRDLKQYKDYYNSDADTNIKALNEYKNTIRNKVKYERYAQPMQQAILAKADRAIQIEQKRKNEVTSATSLAAVRVADFKYRLLQTYPENDPVRSGENTLRAAYQQPYLVIRPAVTSLKQTINNVDGKSERQAQVMAYRSLYGTMATMNIPTGSETDRNITYKVAMANYATERLSQVARQQNYNEQESRDIASVGRAVSELPPTNDPTDRPSGIYRSTYLYGTLVETPRLDGSTDLTYNVRLAASGTRPPEGSRLDVAAVTDVRKFAAENYPRAYYGDDMTKYRDAVNSCGDIFVNFHKDKEPIVAKQVALGLKAAGYKKEAEAISSRSASPQSNDAQRIGKINSELPAMEAELAKLDQQAKESGDKLVADITACGETKIKPTLTTITAKSKDLPAMYDNARKMTSALYQ